MTEADKRKIRSRAQSRALSELARRHPDEYRTIYLAAKAATEKEAQK